MSSSISTFNDNQFAYRRATRNEVIASSPRKLKRHMPLWLDAIIVLALLGGAGYVGYVLTHPSPHRSATAIATNFVEQIGSGNLSAAAADVDPADQVSALSTLRSNGGMPGGEFADTHSTKPGSTNVTGTTATVVISACNSSLACNDLPPVPCVEVGGKWYVSWRPLLQSTSS
jgi:hypothetical protein